MLTIRQFTVLKCLPVPPVFLLVISQANKRVSAPPNFSSGFLFLSHCLRNDGIFFLITHWLALVYMPFTNQALTRILELLSKLTKNIQRIIAARKMAKGNHICGWALLVFLSFRDNSMSSRFVSSRHAWWAPKGWSYLIWFEFSQLFYHLLTSNYIKVVIVSPLLGSHGLTHNEKINKYWVLRTAVELNDAQLKVL